jgi:hypothetical protein
VAGRVRLAAFGHLYWVHLLSRPWRIVDLPPSANNFQFPPREMHERSWTGRGRAGGRTTMAHLGDTQALSLASTDRLRGRLAEYRNRGGAPHDGRMAEPMSNGRDGRSFTIARAGDGPAARKCERRLSLLLQTCLEVAQIDDQAHNPPSVEPHGRLKHGPARFGSLASGVKTPEVSFLRPGD